MSKKRHFTAEEAAAFLTADSDPEASDLELSSEDDSSLVDDNEQALIPDLDSDDTDATVTSSESETEEEEEEELDPDDINTDKYYKTRDEAVKWNRNIPSQRGRPARINIVDANSVGPTPIVPENIDSPLEAFNLTFPDECIDIIIRYTNQRYEDYCRQNHRSSAAKRFGGYRPFSKEEILAFIGLSFISGANKSARNPISDLYNSQYLPHFRASISGTDYFS